jgi:CRP-like cAMP-binding protein
MDHEIDRFMLRYVGVSASDKDSGLLLRQYLSAKQLAKGDYLVQEGQRHPYAYFMVEGAVRSFYLKDGTEVNTWFAFEDEIVGSFQNYLGQPSRETLQATENSRLIAINLSGLKTWADRDVHASGFIRRVVEEYTIFLEEKLLALQMNATERYRYLLEKEPQLLQRVPLTYIASYLGISRETLSRIRATITL